MSSSPVRWDSVPLLVLRFCNGVPRFTVGTVETRVLGRCGFPQVLLSGGAFSPFFTFLLLWVLLARHLPGPCVRWGVLCTYSRKVFDPPRSRGIGADLDFVMLPTRRELEVDAGEAWLGVTVLEAHRQPCTLGVRIARSQGLISLFSKVRRWLEQRRPYSCRVVAVAPQRFAGSAQLLVYPESLDAQALVAVVVDLSRVGGHYYAENVYRHMTTEEFLGLVQSELDWDPEDVAVYVGSGFLLRLPPEELCVAHGDVDTVLRREVHTPTSPCLSALFQYTADWDSLQNVPIACSKPGVAVWFRDRIWPVGASSFPDSDVLAILAARFHVPVSALSVQTTSALEALASRGEPCASLVVVTETDDADETSTQHATTTWTLVCDLRPLGVCPKVVRLDSHDCGIDSLLASLALPHLPGFELVISELPSPGVGLPALLFGSQRVEAEWSAPPLRTAAPWGALDALLCWFTSFLSWCPD